MAEMRAVVLVHPAARRRTRCFRSPRTVARYILEALEVLVDFVGYVVRVVRAHRRRLGCTVLGR